MILLPNEENIFYDFGNCRNVSSLVMQNASSSQFFIAKESSTSYWDSGGTFSVGTWEAITLNDYSPNFERCEPLKLKSKFDRIFWANLRHFQLKPPKTANTKSRKFPKELQTHNSPKKKSKYIQKSPLSVHNLTVSLLLHYGPFNSV